MLSLNPVLYWALDETSGTTAEDIAGNHDATHSGATVGGYALTPDDGDHSVDYDGNDDHTESGTVNISGGLSFPVTLVAVVRITEEDESGCVLDYSDPGSDDSVLRVDIDAGSLAMSTNGQTTFDRATSPKSHDDGVRRLVMITFTSQTERTLRVDNEDAVTSSVNVGLQSSTSRKVSVAQEIRDLGGNDLGNFKGEVSHVAIFHSALSDDDRKRLWRAFRPRGRFLDAIVDPSVSEDRVKAGMARFNQTDALGPNNEPGVYVASHFRGFIDSLVPEGSHKWNA